MRKILLSIAALAALSAGSATSAFAAQPGAAYGKSVGTITWITPGVATNPDEVRRQGGFATPGAVHWIPTSYARANA